MNFSMRNSGRQGFYDEEEQQEQQGKHLHHHHHHQYPCFNSSSPNYDEHHHRGWLDSHVGGGGGPNSELELSVMDTSTAHDDHESSNTRGGGGGSAVGQVVPEVEREHMFDKVVTPSDVGKLNRLVIPKQHAERYFPLDSSTNEKGLLLNFEDRNGKPWRFRYSYWNSSQSYVMTKGWSRFVKEKKLDAGDIVSFQRGVGDLGKDRLFIDWRRRPDAPHHPQLFPHHLNYSFFQRSTTPSSPSPSLNMMNNIIHHQHHHPNPMVPWNPIFLQSQRGGGAYGLGHSQAPPPNYNYNYGYNTTTTANTPCQGSVIYFRSSSASASASLPQQQLGMQVQIQQRGISSDQVQPLPVVFESVPVVHGKIAAKRLRLFGVNMDCPIDSQPSSTNTNAPYDHHYNTTSSSSTIPYLQLTPNFNPTPSSSSDTAKALDLDI